LSLKKASLRRDRDEAIINKKEGKRSGRRERKNGCGGRREKIKKNRNTVVGVVKKNKGGSRASGAGRKNYPPVGENKILETYERISEKEEAEITTGKDHTEKKKRGGPAKKEE